MHEPALSATGLWDAGWDEAGLREWAEGLRRKLGNNPVTLGLIFTTPDLFPHAAELLELVRVHARIPALAGCSSHGLVVGGREIERGGRVVLGLYSIPGASFEVLELPEAAARGERDAIAALGLEFASVTGWLAFLDPFRTEAEAWIHAWQGVHPGAPVFGGLAAGRPETAEVRIYADGGIARHGGVVVAIRGVRVEGLVAQGCTPVGETWTITRAEGNVVHRIGNRPATAVLEETFEDLEEDLRRRGRGHFFAGLAVDEYRERHHRGDFLVRNLLGADPESGALAFAALPRAGQTMQFQLRDAASADQDLRERLGRLRDAIGRSRIYAGCVCLCAGRGVSLFGEADHDAGLIRQMLGPFDLAGFFGNGEFGPVGARSFVHAYTASLLLFVGPPRSLEDDL